MIGPASHVNHQLNGLPLLPGVDFGSLLQEQVDDSIPPVIVSERVGELTASCATLGGTTVRVLVGDECVQVAVLPRLAANGVGAKLVPDESHDAVLVSGVSVLVAAETLVLNNVSTTALTRVAVP